MIDAGDARRQPLGGSIGFTLLVALAFVTGVVVVKDVRPLSVAAPWGEDPYDAFFSFAIFFVGGVALITFVRVLLCRRDEALTSGSLRAVVRGCLVMLVTMTVTLAAGWASVAPIVAVATVGSVTALQGILIAGLTASTVLVSAAAIALWRTTRMLDLVGDGDAGQDWIADALVLSTYASRRLGPAEALARKVIGTIEGGLAPAMRRHRIVAASLAAAAFGAFVAVGAALEQDPPTLVLIILAVGAGAMLAFLVTIGSYLDLLSATGPSGRPAALVHAAIGAAVALPLAVAFRDGLWWLVGSNAADARLQQLAGLLAISAVVGFLVVLAVSSAIRRLDGR